MKNDEKIQSDHERVFVFHFQASLHFNFEVKHDSRIAIDIIIKLLPLSPYLYLLFSPGSRSGQLNERKVL